MEYIWHIKGNLTENKGVLSAYSRRRGYPYSFADIRNTLQTKEQRKHLKNEGKLQTDQ